MDSKAKTIFSREERVVNAAIDVFTRHGYSRTTMGDIAQRAGISRPALYLIFPGKEDVYAAAIQQMSTTYQTEVRAALLKLPGLEKKLYYCCEKWAAHGFDLVQAHPDARDLFNLDFVPVQEMYDAFQELLAEIIGREGASSDNKDAVPQELARTLVYAIRGFRETVRSKADMQQIVALQVGLVAERAASLQQSG